MCFACSSKNSRWSLFTLLKQAIQIEKAHFGPKLNAMPEWFNSWQSSWESHWHCFIYVRISYQWLHVCFLKIFSSCLLMILNLKIWEYSLNGSTLSRLTLSMRVNEKWQRKEQRAGKQHPLSLTATLTAWWAPWRQ